MSKLPSDYIERVYAGVLGKIIGVYLGRPFEGWTYERIMEQLGPIEYYVHEKLGMPLIVTDDDISGTFTFVRAMEDFGYSKDLTAAQIGQTWLNYIIEDRTVLWWGGMGTSTEHTAYLRLKRGIQAPMSGSMELNGQVVAEQIGAQIFIDGWAMVAPGDPELAAELAKRAGQVSHDGEAVYGGQVIAAMEAQAFVERDMDKLFDCGVQYIPADCVIRKVVDDVRNWAAQDGDWEKTFKRIQGSYGYDKFGGGCHMVPNHALIVLALAYAPENFQQAMLIVNTAGWDTDCNSANVGCLLGIKNGLASLDAGPDWRGPVADKLFIPTADGGRCISDAVLETYELAKAGCALVGEACELPKNGARFHFELPGSVQGFTVEDSAACRDVARVRNVKGHSAAGTRSLAIRYSGLSKGRAARVSTPVFVSPADASMKGYELIASPTLYPGQKLRAEVEACPDNKRPVQVRPYVRYIGEKDALTYAYGEAVELAAGSRAALDWTLPGEGGHPYSEVGVEVLSAERADGTVFLDYLTWDGAPTVTFKRPADGGSYWKQVWVAASDRFREAGGAYEIAQSVGVGLASTGTRQWAEYRVEAPVWIHMGPYAGIAACVQGQKRYYALLLSHGNTIQLVKENYGRSVLAEDDFAWSFDTPVDLALETRGGKLTAYAGGKKIFEVEDSDRPFVSGGVGMVCEEGRARWAEVSVKPVS